MMDFKGHFVNAAKDWNTGKWNITFTFEQADISLIDKIKDVALLDITAKKHYERRSNNSNAYAWVLMQKIAEAVESDKWSVYLQMLQRYSPCFTHIIVKPEAVQAVMDEWRTAIDLGEVVVNGESGHLLQVYYGSHTFNSSEMTIFVAGIVRECEAIGIQTMTPNEIARMNAEWDAYKERHKK